MQPTLKETTPEHVLEGRVLELWGAVPGSGHRPTRRRPDHSQPGLHGSEQVLRWSGANLQSPRPQ